LVDITAEASVFGHRSLRKRYASLFNPYLNTTVLAVSSLQLAVHGFLTAVIYVLFPFAEERWLREHYETYCNRTPRFVGWKSISKFFGEYQSLTGQIRAEVL